MYKRILNERKLSDIATMIDYRGKTPQKSTSGIPLITAKIVKNGTILPVNEFIAESQYASWMTRGYPCVGDVVMTTEAPLGEVAQLRDAHVALAQRIITIRGKNDVLDNGYLKYFLQSAEGQGRLRARETGTTVTGIKAAELRELMIPLPDIVQQRKISKVLLDLDEKIYNLTQINHNLEEQAKAIFDDMFPGITDGDSCVGDIITPKRGKSLLSKDAVPGDVPVIAGGLEPATFHNVSNTIPPVLTISASGANAGYVSLWTIPVWSSDSSFIDSSMTGNVYFWYVLLKKRQKEIFDAQTGSAQPHIYPQHIAQMSLANISKQDIEAFTSTVKPIFDTIGENKKQNSRLAQLRDTLLPKLMSGELDISEVQV